MEAKLSGDWFISVFPGDHAGFSLGLLRILTPSGCGVTLQWMCTLLGDDPSGFAVVWSCVHTHVCVELSHDCSGMPTSAAASPGGSQAPSIPRFLLEQGDWLGFCQLLLVPPEIAPGFLE